MVQIFHLGPVEPPEVIAPMFYTYPSPCPGGSTPAHCPPPITAEAHVSAFLPLQEKARVPNILKRMLDSITLLFPAALGIKSRPLNLDFRAHSVWPLPGAVSADVMVCLR